MFYFVRVFLCLMALSLNVHVNAQASHKSAPTDVTPYPASRNKPPHVEIESMTDQSCEERSGQFLIVFNGPGVGNFPRYKITLRINQELNQIEINTDWKIDTLSLIDLTHLKITQTQKFLFGGLILERFYQVGQSTKKVFDKATQIENLLKMAKQNLVREGDVTKTEKVLDCALTKIESFKVTLRDRYTF